MTFSLLSPPPEYETLVGLLERYSPTGQESTAVHWLVERMHKLGYSEAWIDDAGNAIGVMGKGRQQGILLGHIDTVPGEIPLRLEEDALYGRGAVDAKGSLATLVDGVAQVGPVDGWQWVIIGAVDEEGDSRGARAIVDRYRPAFVIVGEPSGWDRVTLGYKGSVWSTITIRRPLTHSAAPQASACEAAADCWRSVQALASGFNRDRRRAFDQVTPSLRRWSSGDDGFQAWARLHVATRLPPGLTADDWLARLHSLDPEVEVEADGIAIPAYRAEKNSPLTRAFLAAIRALGGRPSFALKTGTADLNIVAPAWSCPAVAYGPGDSSLDHTPQEHILLPEYTRARDVLAGVLRRFGR
ncbi:MAG: [LysW]-lysine hydrolase [Chloroflexota bacterium]